ncbi:MAG TPA: hypothetical protein VFA49_14980 [Chloroflexota bacterium]|nr:hypothetical protein [Chloroflexota bacterium]
MSVVVPFPEARVAQHAAMRGRTVQVVGLAGHAGTAHPIRGGGVISWLRPAQCMCCGRPTLAGQVRPSNVTLCAHCTPPSVA